MLRAEAEREYWSKLRSYLLTSYFVESIVWLGLEVVVGVAERRSVEDRDGRKRVGLCSLRQGEVQARLG